MANEAAVLKEVKRILNDQEKCLGMRVTNVTGFPDMLACINGRFVGIEVKDDINGPYTITKGQIIRLKQIVRAGGLACVVDKENLDLFKLHIKLIAESPHANHGWFGSRSC